VVGERLEPRAIDSLRRELPAYGLSKARLLLRQPFGKQLSPTEVSDLIRDGIKQSGLGTANRDALATENRIRALQDSLARVEVLPVKALVSELSAMYPELTAMSLARRAAAGDTSAPELQAINVVAHWKRPPSAIQHARIRAWLAARLQTQSLELIDVRQR
jgi:hypothetical protein